MVGVILENGVGDDGSDQATSGLVCSQHHYMEQHMGLLERFVKTLPVSKYTVSCRVACPKWQNLVNRRRPDVFGEYIDRKVFSGFINPRLIDLL